MLRTIAFRCFPHRILKNSNVRLTFDSLEKAYLIHWSLGLETALSLGIGIVLTILIVIVIPEGE